MITKSVALIELAEPHARSRGTERELVPDLYTLAIQTTKETSGRLAHNRRAS